MKASILDLRRRMSDVLRALERNEPVTILYRGKEKGIIYPTGAPKGAGGAAADHPAFGMWKNREDMRDPAKVVGDSESAASMIFDTDVLIWFLRGNPSAATAIEAADEREISVVSTMELLQGARDRREVRTIKSFLADFAFRTLPLTENIGHRASIYMEEYALKVAMGVADALVAATAVENQRVLATANQKHYRPIRDLEIRVFRP